MPFFSVVIPVFNRTHTITRAIDSVVHQTCRDYECIVVDDGSTDALSDVLAQYDNRIRCIQIDHAGVSAARNAGIQNSSSAYIAFLDSDDEWLPDKLEVQKKYIFEHPEICIHQTDELWIRNGVRVIHEKTCKTFGTYLCGIA